MMRSSINNNNLSRGTTGLKFRLTLAAALVAAVTVSVSAQEGQIEEVEVFGIRSSLQNALEEKRDSTNLVEIIRAENIGKLPDQNLAEVLENITAG